MEAFFAPTHLTVAFVLLTLAVVVADILLVRRAAPEDRRATWTGITAVIAGLWLAGHAAVAMSGILEGQGFPPPVAPYLLVNFLTAFAVAASPVGKRLAALPVAFLVGLQSFRLPLEVILDQLYKAGSIPAQMTWSGMNYDVFTAILAIGLAIALKRGSVPSAVVWAWNILGSVLLLTVVTIALLSAPLPIRQFHNEPAVLLPFNAPYNWIVNVHVWTAMVGHLVIFRALWGRRAKS